jgi:hypothetical protein
VSALLLDRTFWLEVGFRAALHAETCQRDLRWFQGLDWKHQPKEGGSQNEPQTNPPG